MASSSEKVALSPEEAKSAALVVGGVTVRLMNDSHFKALRVALGYEAWLSAAVSSFDWGRMAAGGGKGGDKMARTNCRRFFIKEVSGGDLETLTNVSFLRSYVARVSTGKSLIVHIVAHFAKPDGQTCIIMNNWLPPNNVPFSRLYDLKGTSDDKVLVVEGVHVPEVHKRFYKLSWLLAEAACGASTSATPPERREYALGKEEAFRAIFPMGAAQRDALLDALRDDLAFLASPAAAGGLMDYSIILGMARYGPEEEAAGVAACSPPAGGEPTAHARPLLVRHSGQLCVYYVGIIDFLQQWTTGKKVAHVIKACCAPHPISTVPPAEYAQQFLAHFENAFRACVPSARAGWASHSRGREGEEVKPAAAAE